MTTHEVEDVFGNTHVLDTDNLVLSSDLHLNHANILKYGRGTNWLTIDAHNHAILENIYHGSIGKQLILLGDLVMGPRIEGLPLLAHLAEDLEVEYILNISGNHDHTWYRNKRHAEWREKYRDIGRVITLPEQVVLEGTEISTVVLCHLPYVSVGDHTAETRYEDERPADDGHYLLHGHVHGTMGKLTSSRSVDIGVDAWNYYPVLFREVVKLFKSQSGTLLDQ